MPQTKQLSALVTGATGFLGQHLCQKLLDQNWQVFALCRSRHKAQALNNKVHIIKGDVIETQAFKEALPENLQAIFHTAASTNTWFKNNAMQTRTNITGTQNLVALASELNVKRFIHISSVVVFGIHKHLQNITEDLPKSGKDSWINYVKTKVASEQCVLDERSIDSVVVNPTHIIGPGDRNNWARLIKMIAQQKLPSIPNGAGSFVDVRDVAAGIISAYHLGQSHENYLLGGTDMSFNKFVHQVAEKLKVKPTRLQLPNALLMLLAKTKNSWSRLTNTEPDITPESVSLISDLYGCDSHKAKVHLNYQPRNFEDTLEDTVTFLKHESII